MRESVYWPNIYKDIDMMVKCCAVCQESQTEHRQQPLLAHDVPSTPWTMVASDVFQIKEDTYLCNVLHVFISTANTTTTSQTTPPEVNSPHSVERCITDDMQQYSER